MKTMEQLMFGGPDRLEWREVAAPTIERDREALVRPLAVTRCDLDLYIATGLYPIEPTFGFGHEIAGEVLAVGDGVTRVQPGDRVIVPFQIHCGECGPCRRGHTNACASVPRCAAYGLGLTEGIDWGGGLSDCLKVPYADAMLVGVPDGLSLPAAAAISDNAVDGFRTVARPLAERPGVPVLVVGGLAQSVGLFAVQAALHLGAERVVYRDFDPGRLARARAMGAEANAIDYDREDRPSEVFPIVVEAAGLRGALRFAIDSTEPCGICTGVSAGTSTVAEVPLRRMYLRGIRYEVGRVHARATIPDLLRACVHQDLDPASLIDREIPFSQASEAMTGSEIKPVFVRASV